MVNLKGKVALVTGATSGIGHVTAEYLAGGWVMVALRPACVGRLVGWLAGWPRVCLLCEAHTAPRVLFNPWQGQPWRAAGS